MSQSEGEAHPWSLVLRGEDICSGAEARVELGLHTDREIKL